jgi:hypothetical protein
MEIIPTQIPTISTTSKDWWESRRQKYNVLLVVAGVTAFILYAILGSLLLAPYDDEFEITLFTIFFQGVGYLIMMGAANFCYSLGQKIENQINKQQSDSLRQRFFNFGCLFSFCLPFLIPVLVIVSYFVQYKK